MSRTVADLKKLALFKKQTFNRTVSTETYLTDEGALAICKLHDNYHDMEFALLVDTDTYEIKDVSAQMNRYPFDTCIHSLNSYKRLIGVKVLGGGVLHSVHRLIPRVDGCTHLYTALEASLRALFIGVGYEQDRSVPRTRQENQEYLREHILTRNTCVSFRTDGELPNPPVGG